MSDTLIAVLRKLVDSAVEDAHDEVHECTCDQDYDNCFYHWPPNERTEAFLNAVTRRLARRLMEGLPHD